MDKGAAKPDDKGWIPSLPRSGKRELTRKNCLLSEILLRVVAREPHPRNKCKRRKITSIPESYPRWKATPPAFVTTCEQEAWKEQDSAVPKNGDKHKRLLNQNKRTQVVAHSFSRTPSKSKKKKKSQKRPTPPRPQPNRTLSRSSRLPVVPKVRLSPAPPPVALETVTF